MFLRPGGPRPNLPSSRIGITRTHIGLSDLGDKFSQFLSAFAAPALIQHLQSYKAVQGINAAIEPAFVKKNAFAGHKYPTPGVRVFLTKTLVRFQGRLSACLSIRESSEPLTVVAYRWTHRVHHCCAGTRHLDCLDLPHRSLPS